MIGDYPAVHGGTTHQLEYFHPQVRLELAAAALSRSHGTWRKADKISGARSRPNSWAIRRPTVSAGDHPQLLLSQGPKRAHHGRTLGNGRMEQPFSQGIDQEQADTFRRRPIGRKW